MVTAIERTSLITLLPGPNLSKLQIFQVNLSLVAVVAGLLVGGLGEVGTSYGVQLLKVASSPDAGWPRAIPFREGCLLDLAAGPADPDNYGLRLSVACEGETLYSSRGLMDTEFVEPEFFAADGHLVMLANVGAEESWGLLGLDLSNAMPTELGTIDVAAPRADPGAYLTSALPLFSLFASDGTYTVVFEAAVLLNPGSPKEELTSEVDGPVALRWTGDSWVRGGGATDE